MSRDLSYYKSLRYKMVLEYDKKDRVYFVNFPDLPGCLAHGKTEQEALKTALKIKDEWLEATYAAGWEVPEPSEPVETTGRVTLRLPKYLHQKIIERADAEGVSQNQLILSFLAQCLEKAGTEDSFAKIAQKQEEMIGLIKARRTVTAGQQAFNPSFFAFPSHVNDFVCSVGLAAGATLATSGTTEIYSSIVPPIGGETMARLKLVTNNVLRASEDEYQGGYAHEA
jgi:antitoxin HicB